MEGKAISQDSDLRLALAARLHVPAYASADEVGLYAERVVLPLLGALKEHPAVNINLALSGTLCERLETAAPQTIEQIAGLVSDGRVEIVGGGEYAPLFAAIPDADALGQINRLIDRIVQRFDFVPRGLWLDSFVWDGRVAGVAGKTGAEYAVVGGHSLRAAGVADKVLSGAYVTECGGYVCKLFAAEPQLNGALLSCANPDVDVLRALASDCGGRVALCAASGRDFAPGEDGIASAQALAGLFSFLSDNAHWIKTFMLGEALAKEPPAAVVHPPVCVPEELEAFVLPSSALDAVRAARAAAPEESAGMLCFGTWAGALDKFPALGVLHKKMLHVSRKVWNFAGAEPNALSALWRAQAADVFLPAAGQTAPDGAFMDAAYSDLVRAEIAADAVRQKRRDWLECECVDFDCDGRDEVLLNSSQVNLYFAPGRGGRLFEFDSRAHCVNLASGRGLFVDSLINAGGAKDAPVIGDFGACGFEHSVIRRDEQSFVRMLCETGLAGTQTRLWLEKTFSIAAYRKVVADYRLSWSADEIPEGARLCVLMDSRICVGAEGFAETADGKTEIIAGQETSVSGVVRAGFAAGGGLPGLDIRTDAACDLVLCPDSEAASRFCCCVPLAGAKERQIGFRMVMEIIAPAAPETQEQAKKTISETE